MVTLMVRCRVTDYDAWRAAWLPALQEHYDRGEVTSYRLWRGVADPNVIVLMEVFASREIAEAVMNAPSAREAMAAHGVEVETIRSELLDEIGAGSR